MRVLGKGGVGATLADFNFEACGFCLKIAKRLPEKQRVFWSAAKSIQIWTSLIRFRPEFCKLPRAVEYWIHKEDLKAKFRRAADDDDRFGLQRYRLGGSLCSRRHSLRELIDCDDRLGNYGDLPEELAEVVPEEYILCPDDVLRQIYEEDRAGYPAELDLLLTYPLQQGAKSVAEYLQTGGSFGEKELIACLYQILSAIDHLYRLGCAHGDIKPANVLVDVDESTGEKFFRLTDFDAFYSAAHPSGAGTAAFLPDERSRRALEVHCRGNDLKYRAALDCFALLQTVSCMADRRSSPSSSPSYRIPDFIRKKIFAIETFHPAQVEELLTKLRRKYHLTTPLFAYLPMIGERYDFDVAARCPLGALGTFHEQLRFEGFDPLLSIPRKEVEDSPELSGLLLRPVAADRKYLFLHAPDDAESGRRPANFYGYTPKSLADTTPSPGETRTLLAYGKTLNEFFDRHPGKAETFLPAKEEILWVDGELRILWIRRAVARRVNCEVYFRWLLNGSTRGFSTDDWHTLLFTLPELETALTAPVCRRLREAFPNEMRFWQFAAFRKHILEKRPPLPLQEWREICRHTDEWDALIDEETAWGIFRLTSGRETGDLLKTHPKIAALLNAAPPYFLDHDAYFAALCDFGCGGRKLSPRWFAAAMPGTFTAREWSKILCLDPALLPLVPKDQLAALPRKTWVRLLGEFPELRSECPSTERFSASEWCGILLRRPELAEHLPKHIRFSDRERSRLRKKGVIPPAE